MQSLQNADQAIDSILDHFDEPGNFVFAPPSLADDVHNVPMKVDKALQEYRNRGESAQDKWQQLRMDTMVYRMDDRRTKVHAHCQLHVIVICGPIIITLPQ